MQKEGTSATRAKNKYRDKTYDQMNIIVPKGKKAELQAYAESKSESLSGFVNRAIKEAIEREQSRGDGANAASI